MRLVSAALRTAAIAAVSLAIAGSVSLAEQGASPPPTPALFVVLFRTGPAWDKARPPNAQPFMAEHSANLRALREEKRIPLGGRYADVGLVVLTAESEAEARSWIERDPAVKNGTFVFELHPFRPFMTGCVGKTE
jgi:uncharacterized protein YciI